MAAWTNYRALKQNSAVEISLDNPTSGAPAIKTERHRFNAEDGTRIANYAEVDDLVATKIKRAEIAKDLANIDAWIADADALMAAWEAEHIEPEPEV